MTVTSMSEEDGSLEGSESGSSHGPWAPMERGKHIDGVFFDRRSQFMPSLEFFFFKPSALWILYVICCESTIPSIFRENVIRPLRLKRKEKENVSDLLMSHNDHGCP